MDEENIVSPASRRGLYPFVDLSCVAKEVAEFVFPSRDLVVKRDGVDPHLGKAEKLVRLRDSVMILVNPQQQSKIHSVVLVDNSVAITSIFRLVEFC
jgi:hypothetical protein